MRKFFFLLMPILLLRGVISYAQNTAEAYMLTPSLAFKDAKTSFAEGDYEQAIKLVKVYKSLSGSNEGDDLLHKAQQCQDYLESARHFEEQGNYEGATQCYQNILGINPNDPNVGRHTKNQTITLKNGQTITIAGIDFVYVRGDNLSGINDFLIGKYEVTNGQWRNIMGSIPSATKTLDHPVHNVTYKDAKAFIDALNSSNPGYHFRLPTKEEWQWAAHGGINKETYRYSGSDNYDDVAWLRDNSGVQENEEYSVSVSHTHRVGTKKPNSLGIYDMSGNVDEIYSDLDGKNHKQIGGSYWINYWWAYSTIETPENYSNSTYDPDPSTGFRLVIDVNGIGGKGASSTFSHKTPSHIILTKSESIYCDGVYHGPDWEYDYKTTALYENLGPQFNRSFFSISFDYYMIQGDSIITIDTGRRVFGLVPKGNTIIVTTNNQDNYFDTSIDAMYEKWQHIDLIYDHGVLVINGKNLNIGELNSSSDNILSSVNFSNGRCFKGNIRNLVVKSE